MDWKNILTNLENHAVDIALKLMGALLVLVIGFKIAKSITKLVKKLKGMSKLDPTAANFIVSAIGILLKVVVIISAVAIMGVSMTSVITLLASAGVAVSLALQGSLSNFASGLMLLIFRPFKVGDFIEVAGQMGTVDEISIFYTHIITVDNRRVVLPNSQVSGATLINYSSEKLRRVDLEFSVSFDSDINEVNFLMEHVAKGVEKICEDPAVFVGLVRQDESALVFVLRAWCQGEDYWAVYFELQEKMKKAFDKAGIKIPYPQLDVHLDK